MFNGTNSPLVLMWIKTFSSHTDTFLSSLQVPSLPFIKAPFWCLDTFPSYRTLPFTLAPSLHPYRHLPITQAPSLPFITEPSYHLPFIQTPSLHIDTCPPHCLLPFPSYRHLPITLAWVPSLPFLQAPS